MGQQEILKVLKQDEWQSAVEIGEQIPDMGQRAVQMRLTVLREWGEVECLKRKGSIRHHKYKLNKVAEDGL